MIVFDIIIWSIVSAVWAALAWWKSSEGTKVWPDVLASASAAGVVITYIVKWWAS
nr:MAG TPA: hypothetical protein [Caudoviricetes sp.]